MIFRNKKYLQSSSAEGYYDSLNVPPGNNVEFKLVKLIEDYLESVVSVNGWLSPSGSAG